MKTERELAELIFDKFREARCKENGIVPLRNIHNDKTIMNLNPKEKDLFLKVLNGLIFTGYYTYEKGGLECLQLTQKGFDYIYDDDAVKSMVKKPWVFPEAEKTDWDKAYNRLWRVIGKEENSFYIKGSKFYEFVAELSDEIPPSYNQYIDYRRKKGLSTSRVDYYKDLINLLDDESKLLLYAKIQIFIEIDFSKEKEETNNSWDFPILSNEEKPLLKEEKPIEQKDVVHPKVFISYSWDDKEHENWVLKLAEKLCENGVDITLDKWELDKLGKSLPNFMENSIRESERVICVMTPNYKIKTEKPKGGVGYEYSIITATIFKDIETSKFIPLLRGDENTSMPLALDGRKYIDMRSDTDFEIKVEELLRDIYKEPKDKKPPIGNKPKFD
ncbi:toll/interleukin-1 receptor domain-containing protein [Capnocytophaga cynodegmi]|uniref:toll/interleukin-1 receptor domain-containing protein n=1 Tax=Capnocytophaga cynodegmi TaxID=28189 RepID=UPI00385C5654